MVFKREIQTKYFSWRIHQKCNPDFNYFFYNENKAVKISASYKLLYWTLTHHCDRKFENSLFTWIDENLQNSPCYFLNVLHLNTVCASTKCGFMLFTRDFGIYIKVICTVFFGLKNSASTNCALLLFCTVTAENLPIVIFKISRHSGWHHLDKNDIIQHNEKRFSSVGNRQQNPNVPVAEVRIDRYSVHGSKPRL